MRHDPPQEVHYDDIEIASEGDSETIKQVSQTLNSVATDKVFDYLLDQADKLGASDIHIENMRNEIRIRMRVDGILHPVAEISRDKYRIFMGELSSRANVSTASIDPQSGHMQKDITRDGATHLLNIRVEMVPTMYGQDAVLRLFNFDESLLNLDLLGITKEERAEIQEMVSHPRGLLLMVGPTGSGKSTTLYSILNALEYYWTQDYYTWGSDWIWHSGYFADSNCRPIKGGSFAEGLALRASSRPWRSNGWWDSRRWYCAYRHSGVYYGSLGAFILPRQLYICSVCAYCRYDWHQPCLL